MKRSILLLNVGKSIEEFENGFYLCPNNKDYSFNQNFNFIAGHYNKQVQLIAEIRARGVLKINNGIKEVSLNSFNMKTDNEENLKREIEKAFDKAQEINVFDRSQEAETCGSQVFLLKNIQPLNATYTHGSYIWSKVYLEVYSEQNITIELITSRLYGENLNKLKLKKINLDAMSVKKIGNITEPQAQQTTKKQDSSSTETITKPQQKILFCNIGWMEKYEGPDGNRLKSGGSYPKRYGTGGEQYNFYDHLGYCYGFFETSGDNVAIKRIDKNCDNDFVDDVLVVWVANNPNDNFGTRIVGFYNHATVYRQMQKDVTINGFGYNVKAEQKFCYCIPIEQREFEVPRQQKGFFGEKQFWYADADSKEVVDYKKRVIDYYNKEIVNKNHNPISSVDIEDADYQDDVNEYINAQRKIENIIDTPIEAESVSVDAKQYETYPRDPANAAAALRNANYLCEVDNTHKLFIRRNGKINYTESHHLIPMKYQYKFKNKLDCPANIVSLCSHCHNKLHYGKDIKDELTYLYQQRKSRLEAAGISITLEELFNLYK